MRMAVADLAYHELVVDGRAPQVVGSLVAAINSASVVVEGKRIHTAQAWSQLFDRALTGIDAVTIAHPSTWGSRRAGVLRQAAAPYCRELEIIPRAVVIARSHLDSSAQRALVVEVHGHMETRERVDIHQLQRVDGEWQIASTTVAGPDTYADVVATLADDRIEAILVDGTDPRGVEAVRRRVEEVTVVGRVARVRRSLIHRYGGATLVAIDDEEHASGNDAERIRSRSRRWPVVAGATLVCIALAAVVVVVATREAPEATTEVLDRQAQIGRVAIAVPGGWRASSEPAAEGVVSRSTFAAPDDDRRVIVLQNTVRGTSTLSSVAGSLRNRIDQRGDEVVQEFSASTRYAGRDVISYREVPVSGGPIRWYLLVSAGLQVSVGCQAGSAGESIDGECQSAVGSVRIAEQ